MIAYFLGIPGSGKTYYGVNVIYDNFAKKIPKKTKLTLKKDYVNCYTNINEFNFKYTKNVKKFDFDEFYIKLQILYNLAHGVSDIFDNDSDSKNDEISIKTFSELINEGMSSKEAREFLDKQVKQVPVTSKKVIKVKATDKQLIQKAKELKIYKTLFVIDECHNFFDMDDKIKVWWLTYHRHLYHDIYLITQNLSLVNVKYKPLAEAYYKAKASSLTLNKKYFNYMYYTDSRMTKDSFVNTIKVLKRQEIFKLYKSGDAVESKNVIKRFIYIALFLFVSFFIIAYLIYEFSVKDKIKKDVPVVSSASSFVTTQNYKEPVSEVVSDVDVSNNILMIFKCNNEMCSYLNYYFDVDVLKYAKENFDMQIINERRLFNVSLISVSIDSSFLTFLGGQNNVQDGEISSIIPSFSK